MSRLQKIVKAHQNLKGFITLFLCLILLGLPVYFISTDVGIAHDFLHPSTVSRSGKLDDIVLPSSMHVKHARGIANTCILQKQIKIYDDFFRTAFAQNNTSTETPKIQLHT